MIRMIAITLVLLAGTQSAHAYGSSDCGPTLNLSANTRVDLNSRDINPTFGATLEFNVLELIQRAMGKTPDCAQSIIDDANESRSKAAADDAKAANDNARARKERALAQQQELRLLNDKIKLCKTFEPDTAPESIKTYCGDLIQ